MAVGENSLERKIRRQTNHRLLVLQEIDTLALHLSALYWASRGE